MFVVVCQDSQNNARNVRCLFKINKGRAYPIRLRTSFRVVHGLMIIAYVGHRFTRFLVFSITLFVQMACTRVRAVFKQDSHGTCVVINSGDYLRSFVLPINVYVPTNRIRQNIFLVNRLLTMWLARLQSICRLRLVCCFLRTRKNICVCRYLSFFNFFNNSSGRAIDAASARSHR